MQYTIENQPVFTTVRVNLSAGEAIRAEAGAMISMSTNIDLKSKTQGKGVVGMLKSAVGGEGLFVSEFTAQNSDGEVLLAPPTPGDVLAIELSGNTVYAQNGAYIGGSIDLELGTKGSLKAMISGEGLFLQSVKGNGTVFFSAYGALIEKNLAQGESYIVDTGHMVAFEETVTYTLRKAAKGLLSTVISGEGLVAEFKGPGKIWIQNRNLKGFAGLIAKLTSKKS